MAFNPLGQGGQPDGQPPRRRGMSMGGMRLWILLAFAGYGLYYYVSNRTVDPYTGEKVLIDKNLSVDDEKALGLQAYQEILSQERPVDPNSDIAKQIREIAQRLIAKTDEVEADLAAEKGLQAQNLAKDFEWDVTVIQSDQVNAFCLPGGKMAVYSGLVPVAQNSDAMSIVMGHEIAHALLRHGAQRMSRQKLEQIGQMAGAMSGVDPGMQQAIFSAYGVTSQLPYARKHETIADEIGLMLSAAACFDPQEAIPLWQRMEQASGGRSQPEFASTHPNPGTRIQNLQAMMPRALAIKQKYCGTGGASGATGAAIH